MMTNMKLFTLNEANALVPRVRSVLLTLRTAYRRLSEMQTESRRAAAAADDGGGGMRGGSKYIQLLEIFVAGNGELENLGVQIKDYNRGLIDFPTVREGKVVLLCWELGEGDEVGWWHDVDAGYAGRQKL
jgi:hypothetical protein